MSKITVKVEGLDKLLKSLQNESEEIKQQIGFEIRESANEMANRAAADVPVDQGLVRAEISSIEVDELTYDVVSPADYSAFLEFGTKSKVSIPAGLEDVAAQFRGGKNGTADQAKKAIFEWCRRKGIEESAWYPIYRSVMMNGIRPQPFFFKQLAREKNNLIKNIKQVLKNR